MEARPWKEWLIWWIYKCWRQGTFCYKPTDKKRLNLWVRYKRKSSHFPQLIGLDLGKACNNFHVITKAHYTKHMLYFQSHLILFLLNGKLYGTAMAILVMFGKCASRRFDQKTDWAPTRANFLICPTNTQRRPRQSRNENLLDLRILLQKCNLYKCNG